MDSVEEPAARRCCNVATVCYGVTPHELLKANAELAVASTHPGFRFRHVIQGGTRQLGDWHKLSKLDRCDNRSGPLWHWLLLAALIASFCSRPLPGQEIGSAGEFVADAADQPRYVQPTPPTTGTFQGDAFGNGASVSSPTNGGKVSQRLHTRISPAPSVTADQADDGECLIEDFEGVKPSWKIARHDALSGVISHRRTDVMPFSGRRSEYVAVIARRGGERVMIDHRIPRSAAIDELRAAVWIKGDQEGFQLMGRVRFPRSIDSHGEPHSAEIFGDRYTSAGIWQKLVLDDVPAKVQHAARELRVSLGHSVDSTEAYIDQLSLNIFGSAGPNRVQIDELSLTASVPVSSTSRNARLPSSLAAGSRQLETLPSEQLVHRFQLNGFDLSAPTLATAAPIRSFVMPRGTKNFVARAVTYHGESFEFLRQLGFNTIWLDTPVSDQQLRRAHELGLWILCPPQIRGTSSLVKSAYGDRILAWSLPSGALHGNPADIATRLRAFKFQDPRRRPVIVAAGALTSTSLHTALGPSNDRLNERGIGNAARRFGVDVVVDSSPQIGSARKRAARRSRDDARWVALGSPVVATSRWIPLRDQIWNSVYQGYEGFLLRTTGNLEDAASQHTRNLAELFNIELGTLRPWTDPESVEAEQIPSSRFIISHLADRHADIVLVQPRTFHAGDRRLPSNEVLIPSSNYRAAYRVEPDGLSPVEYQRVAGGNRIRLDRDKPEGIFLLTDRNAIVTRMTKHLRGTGRRSLTLLQQVIQAELVHLDRRLQDDNLQPAQRSHLRSEVHDLHGRIAWLLEDGDRQQADLVSFRELDHVLGQLERVHRSLEAPQAL